MTIQTTKLIEVLDAQSGRTRETELRQDDQNVGMLEAMAPYPRGAYGEMTIDPLKVNRKLTEAATGEASTANFPDLLRLGVQFDLLSGFNAVPTVYEQLVRMKPSNKQQEEYQDDSGIGLLPIVMEGQSYPEITINVGAGKIIPNYKRGVLMPVTEELMKFDQTGKVRETAELLGRAARMTREQAVMNVITTTTKYQVLNNNPMGTANTATATFGPVTLNTALAVMTTQMDKQSNLPLGVRPKILIVTPLLERFARQMLFSPELWRVGGNTTNEQYGQGTNNPFMGALDTIIVSPLFGASYQWAIIDPSRAIYFQEVEGLSVQVEAGNMTNESWFRRDVIRYKTRDWYGVDMRDDRFAYYSDSTTAPVAA